MIKRIVKHGNGRAISLEKPLLDLLKIDETTDLEISTDGVGLKIYPVSASNSAFQAAKERALKRQQATIKDLSK